jgi:hypothetical protein
MPLIRLARAACLVGATLSLAACGSTNVSTTGPKVPPREANCDFTILTALAGDGYREIGTVDVTPGGYGVNTFTSLESFKQKIQPYVCQAGGDAAFATANGFGMYIKATILKSTGTSTPAAAQDAKTTAGCQFDTQCKGDRVCVKGECADPQKK